MQRTIQALLGSPRLRKPICRCQGCPIQSFGFCPTPQWDPQVYPLANAGQRKEPQPLRIVPIKERFEVRYTVILIKENLQTHDTITIELIKGF